MPKGQIRTIEQVCKKCAAVGERHHLTCPTLRCPQPMWTDDLSLREQVRREDYVFDRLHGRTLSLPVIKRRGQR